MGKETAQLRDSGNPHTYLGWNSGAQSPGSGTAGVHTVACGLWAECGELHRLADAVLPLYEDFHCHAYVLLMVIGLGSLSPAIVCFPHSVEDT
ncbi:MAG: hypothetical protein LKE40_12960 [Spirochaetia bacterium]|jgi:hypothetical protein|nr:hypothetical protein [Spirochaetia bacterium]